MSKIEELMRLLCPDGVEFMSLHDCVERVSNIKWTEAVENEYRYIDLSSVDRDTHTINDVKTINRETAPGRAQQIVKTDDVLLGTTRPMLKRYCLVPNEFDGEICSTGFCVLRVRDDILHSHYLLHVISSTNFFDYVETKQRGTTYPMISDIEVKNYLIPVPPLEVQAEIVRLLDRLEASTRELISLLEREHIARRKQYEYYRDKLLACSGDQVKLSDVAQYEHDTINASEVNAANYVGVDNLLQNKTGKRDSNYVPEAGRVIAFRKDDILIGNIRPYLRKIWFADIDGGTNGDVLAINVLDRERVYPKFLYYVLSSEDFFIYATHHSKTGKMPRGDKKAITMYEFLLPPMDEQKRIAAILERFESLCNDLTQGIPAEIAARKKQYAYYRDKLLTFAPKV